MTTEDEVKDLLEGLGIDEVIPEVPAEEVKVEPEVVVEEPVEEPSKAEPEPEVEAEPEIPPEPEVKVEPEPEVKAEPEVPEEEDLKGQVKGLMARIEELSGVVAAAKIGEVEEEEVEAPVTEVDYLGADVDMEMVREDPKELNKLLNAVTVKASDMAYERALRAIPELVGKLVSRHATLKEMSDQFYVNNSDLVTMKKTVARVANEIHSENPDWTVQKVFDEAGDRTRKILGLKKPLVAETPEEEPEVPISRTPAFATQRGARGGGAQTLSKAQKEIDDLLS